MLYSKIKIEIDTNNDELLETIWEYIINIREIKWGRYLVFFKLINFHLLYHYSYLLLTISKWSLNQNFKTYLTITIYFI